MLKLGQIENLTYSINNSLIKECQIQIQEWNKLLQISNGTIYLVKNIFFDNNSLNLYRLQKCFFIAPVATLRALILVINHTNYKQSNITMKVSTYKIDTIGAKCIYSRASKFSNFKNIKVEIVGSWIWISGDTNGIELLLKNEGFKYASKKQKWFYGVVDGKADHKKESKLTLEEIKNIYGSKAI